MSIFKYILSFVALATLTYASVGRITAINGDISVLRASKTIKASSGFALEEKDSIKSTKGSTAQLVFNDNTVITVGSNTTFSVQEYSSDASSPKARFAIAEGSFKTITGKIGKIAPDKFKMETKTATIGIRGTTLLGKVSSDGELTVACTRGAITVTPVPQISTSGSGTQTPTASQTVVNQGQYTKSKNGNVESPKQLTPGDLINLQGGLAPLARNNTQTTEPQGGSTNETPTAPQNNVGQNSVPNVNPVQQLTEQATSSTINDKVSATVTGGGSKWASAYNGTAYNPGVSYLAEGSMTMFSTVNGVVGSSVYSSSVGFEFDIANNLTTVQNGPYMSTIMGEYSSITSEDSFVVTKLGSYYDNVYTYPATMIFTAVSDNLKPDYVSWGYWAMSYTATNDGNSTKTEYGHWVAGAKTMQSEIDALTAQNATASYKGNVMGGSISDSNPATYNSILMDSTNSATFNVQFGATNSVAGNIKFNTSGGQSWNVNFNGNQVISGNGFNMSVDGGQSISGTGGVGSTVSGMSAGRLEGGFYGSNASAVAGNFKFGSQDGYTASGVFKATKQ